MVNAPESVLSERQGVADFGFLEALGDINVFLAVSIHKRILRSCLQAHGEVTHLPRLVECIGDAIRDQAPLTFDKPVDLMPMMRRVMLQATISFAVGDTGPEYPVKEFIDDYMAFQVTSQQISVLPTSPSSSSLSRPSPSSLGPFSFTPLPLWSLLGTCMYLNPMTCH